MEAHSMTGNPPNGLKLGEHKPSEWMSAVTWTIDWFHMRVPPEAGTGVVVRNWASSSRSYVKLPQLWPEREVCSHGVGISHTSASAVVVCRRFLNHCFWDSPRMVLVGLSTSAPSLRLYRVSERT
jgi:hypothetical protein